ncbi:MAG TPA: XrtB/PEP-CTERM-associated transcriptional regulator EpsA [Burkholderiales bacterium]|nr:XrtB/PEP-CTERM-associated transcriptional regulator EpsA [Burkholderiales bacterium]
MTEDESLIHSRTELDMLLVNIEAAVKVETRPDFFFWVQGVFQGMVAHEALVCGMPDPNGQGLRFEWLGSYPIGPERFAEWCRTDGGLLHALVAAWEQGGRRALLLGATPPADAASALVAEGLRRLDLGDAVAHGLPGLKGTPTAFFAFFKLPAAASAREARMLELLLPYLYTGWLRSSLDQATQAKPASGLPEVLTTREVEVLNWVEKGKSNSEIAQILKISPLTVKNHMQKILRKLNVQNRAQAVAKGISLQLTSRWRASDHQGARGAAHQ